MFEGTIHWISISFHINWTLTVCRHSVKLWGCRCGLITVRCGLVTVLPLNLVYGLVAKKACTQMKYRTKNILSITKRNRLSRTVSKAFIFTESIPTHPWLRCLIQHLPKVYSQLRLNLSQNSEIKPTFIDWYPSVFFYCSWQYYNIRKHHYEQS